MTFNRTTVECKANNLSKCFFSVASFNRTTVECKGAEELELSKTQITF